MSYICLSTLCLTFCHFRFASLLKNKFLIQNPSWNSATYWKSTELIEGGKKPVLIYTTRWQYTAIDDNDGGFSGSTSSTKACTFFHLEKPAGRRWRVRAWVVSSCGWVRACVRDGKENVFCWDAACAGTNPVDYLIELKYLKINWDTRRNRSVLFGWCSVILADSVKVWCI